MKRFPLYPFFVGLFVPLAMYAANAQQVSVRELLWPVAIVVVLAALLLAITAVICRSVHRGAPLAAVALLTILAYGQWRQGLWYLTKPLNLRDAAADTHRMLILQFLILVWLAYFMASRVKQPQILTLRLNQISPILLACPLVFVLARRVSAIGESPSSHNDAARLSGINSIASDAVDDPDIYLIIADAHGRQDILKEMYGYDDAPFLQHLREKGFFVANRSHSNYALTQLSVASMLNMRYLNEFDHIKSVTWDPVMPLLRHSAIVAILQGLDYRYVTFETALPDLCFSDSGDYVHQPGYKPITDFQQMLIDMSLLSEFGSDKIQSWLTREQSNVYQQKRQAVLFELGQGPVVAKLPGPKFVFMHLFCPHTPFVFDVDGSDPVHRGYGSYMDPGLDALYTPDTYRQWYAPQAEFLDGRLSAMIDQILANSAKPPIIVLLSDHGPRSEAQFSGIDPADSNLRECMSNLTAIFLPPRPGVAGTSSQSCGLYPSMTPVNIFRVILNDYFGAKLPLLPDKVFFSCPWYYAYHDVTEIVSDPPNSSPTAN
jgi:hypothetical protein